MSFLTDAALRVQRLAAAGVLTGTATLELRLEIAVAAAWMDSPGDIEETLAVEGVAATVLAQTLGRFRAAGVTRETARLYVLARLGELERIAAGSPP